MRNQSWLDEWGQPLTKETIADLKDFERDLRCPGKLERDHNSALSDWIKRHWHKEPGNV